MTTVSKLEVLDDLVETVEEAWGMVEEGGTPTGLSTHRMRESNELRIEPSLSGCQTARVCCRLSR